MSQPVEPRDTKPLDGCASLTLVIGVVQGSGQNLKGTSKVQEIELGMQGEQNVDGFVSHCGRLGCHLAELDWCGGMIVCVWGVKDSI